MNDKYSSIIVKIKPYAKKIFFLVKVLFLIAFIYDIAHEGPYADHNPRHKKILICFINGSMPLITVHYSLHTNEKQVSNNKWHDILNFELPQPTHVHIRESLKQIFRRGKMSWTHLDVNKTEKCKKET